MIFQFEHMKLWSEEKNNVPLDLVEFKRILSRWQDALEGKGWNALYLENHDQARSIDTFADPTSRYASATALAKLLFLDERNSVYLSGPRDWYGKSSVYFS